jgi:8-amino-7-oxononanoate synthase
MYKMSVLSDKLKQIKKNGLYRQMRYLQSPQGPHVQINGTDYLLLSSNNYLGLCGDSRLKQAAVEAMGKYGVGSGGSRLTTGSYEIHRQLEEDIAVFKGTEAALVFNTGYMANVGTISSIADKDWVIFSDRLNHASIIDGSRLSGAQTVIYDHCNMADLEKKAAATKGRQALIITDSLFSVDGDIAPLPDIVGIARKYDIMTMVDEAHATGVMGSSGGGVADYFGLSAEIDIQMGTLSKALASEGGFIAGERCLIDYLLNQTRSFIFSTALSPATIAVSRKALEIVHSEPKRRETLLANAAWLREELRTEGFQVSENITAIISVVVGEPDLAVTFSNRLMERNIFVSAIRPPTVPSGTSRLRISIMATHTRKDLLWALNHIKEVGRTLGVIK